MRIMLTHCITIEDVLEEFTTNLKDKNGALKVSIIKLLESLFQKDPKKEKPGLKALLPSIVVLFEDSVADVRDKALAFTGKMKNEYGD